jgi:hypothetical protein
LSRYGLAFAAVDVDEVHRSPNLLDRSDRGVDFEFQVAGELRIWVDFERDEILNDSSACGDPRDTSIVLLALYAKEQVKKIRRLSLGGSWVAMMKTNDRRRCWGLSQRLRFFEASEELIVYDSSLAPKPKVPEILEHWKEKVEREIREELQRAQSLTAQGGWAVDLPLIRVDCDF